MSISSAPLKVNNIKLERILLKIERGKNDRKREKERERDRQRVRLETRPQREGSQGGPIPMGY